MPRIAPPPGFHSMLRYLTALAPLLLGLLVLSCAARAEQVEQLFEAQVPVAGQDAGARDTAAREALRRVLVKVGGSRRVLDNPDVTAALRNAPTLLLQYYFQHAEYPPRDDEAESSQLMLHASFQPNAVLDILRRAGEPLLSANRPGTLVWLVLDEGEGPQLLSREPGGMAIDWLGVHAGVRGVPLLFPLLDLEDSLAVTPQQVAGLDMDAVLQASRRYGANSVLMGRLVRSSEGAWMVEWQHHVGEEWVYGQASASSLVQATEQITDAVAETLAQRFAVRAEIDHSEQLRVRVDGVRSYVVYEQLAKLLQGLASVRGLRLALVDRDSLFFDLITDANPDAVQRELTLLAPLRAEGDAAALRYRWVGS